MAQMPCIVHDVDDYCTIYNNNIYILQSITVAIEALFLIFL